MVASKYVEFSACGCHPRFSLTRGRQLLGDYVVRVSGGRHTHSESAVYVRTYKALDVCRNLVVAGNRTRRPRNRDDGSRGPLPQTPLQPHGSKHV